MMRTHCYFPFKHRQCVALLRLASLLLFCLPVLPSCSVYDPGYKGLAAVADASPAPDAIVGMWHRGSSTSGSATVRISLLFNRNGTGLVDAVVHDPLFGTLKARDEIGNFNWSYQGHGVWAMKNHRGRTDYARLAQGKLLREVNSHDIMAFGQPCFFVFEQVNP